MVKKQLEKTEKDYKRFYKGKIKELEKVIRQQKEEIKRLEYLLKDNVDRIRKKKEEVTRKDIIKQKFKDYRNSLQKPVDEDT